MLRVALALAATATGLVLLLSYKTPDQAGGPSAPRTVAAAPQQRPQQQPTQHPASPSPGPGGGGGSRTVTGPSVGTPYGPVQVRVTVNGGRLTDVTTLRHPNDRRRSIEINDQALPILRSEALHAQSADIDEVSGATWTSDAYINSLQSALDKAQG